MASSKRGGRQVIFDGAIKLFNEVGYHGASIRDIAAAADVTVASIYYHFDSKQEILQEIMVAILTDVIEATEASIADASDEPTSQLGALVRCWVEFHTARQAEALIGASEIRSLDEAGLARIVGLRDRQEDIFRAVIDRGVAAGDFKTPDAHEATRAVINMGRSIVNWYRPDGPASAKDLADTYAHLALATVQAL